MSSDIKEPKLIVGDYVKTKGGGQLIGLVVDIWDDGRYVVAYSGGKEFLFFSDVLIKVNK